MPIRKIILAAAAAMALSTTACIETAPDTEGAVEEESELATCQLAPITRDISGDTPSPALSADNASACAVLNDHLASIAHIEAMMESEALDEGGVQ